MAENTNPLPPSTAQPAVRTSATTRIARPDATPRPSEQRAHLDLGTLSRLLLACVDVDPTARRLAELTVPLLGDLCVVHLLDAHGHVASVGVAHANPRQQAVLDQVEPYWHKPSALDHPLARSWQAGESLFVPDVTDAWLHATAADPVQRRLIQSLQIRSLMSVPLISQCQQQHLGALTACWTEWSSRRYATDDLALARDVAGWTAEALSQGRRLRNRWTDQRKIEAERSLAYLAHDLLNTLTVIKMNAQVLPRYVSLADGSGDQRLLAGLAAIDASVSKAATIVDELRHSASAPPGSPLIANRRLTDLVMLCREVAARYQLISAIHQIQVEAGDAVLIGYWDAAGLSRVLDNLVGNAVKYSPSGGEIVLRLRLESDAAGYWAVLAVSDPGLGIPFDDLPHVFDLARRARNVREQIEGTGVGLAFVKEFSEMNHGTVSVVSEEGHGATFTVRLPLADGTGMTESS
jgi:signal transduction histidine kinase